VGGEQGHPGAQCWRAASSVDRPPSVLTGWRSGRPNSMGLGGRWGLVVASVEGLSGLHGGAERWPASWVLASGTTGPGGGRRRESERAARQGPSGGCVGAAVVAMCGQRGMQMPCERPRVGVRCGELPSVSWSTHER
jgi:hypothetical protein